MLLLRPVSYTLMEVFLDYIYMTCGMIGRRSSLENLYMVIECVLGYSYLLIMFRVRSTSLFLLVTGLSTKRPGIYLSDCRAHRTA